MIFTSPEEVCGSSRSGEKPAAFHEGEKEKPTSGGVMWLIHTQHTGQVFRADPYREIVP